MAYQLKLPNHWLIHNAFHVSLLKPYKEEPLGEDITENPPEVEDQEEVLQPESVSRHEDKVLRHVVVDASKIPTCSCLRSQALQYILKKLDPVAAEGDYDLIFVLSPNVQKREESRMLPAWWCLRVYKKLPASYRKNLRRLVFIHPTAHVKLICSMLHPFISKKAHHKVHKVKHLADLEKASGGDISLDVLHLGNHVFKYDQVVATESKGLF
ncbi:hypothetical protein L7F22_054332 [Adiantum nelumboides]|nr:hypothetical protein [Adiantum nelumboides]